MDKTWSRLYQCAMDVIQPREISETMYAASVGAAVLTKKGTIYTGVCIDTSCSLGMCAERNALSAMITQGENEVDKVVAVYQNGKVMPPCGACREFMMQLGKGAKNIEILIDNNGRIAKLSELMPEYPY